MKYNIIYRNPVLGGFFTDPVFPDRIRILADPDPDTKKKFDPDPGKKTGSEILVLNSICYVKNLNFIKIRSDLEYQA